MTKPPSPAAAMKRAREALRAARLLADAGASADSVSRAYYATLHGCLALLASVGLEAKTHEGARSLVSQHFVRTGKLPKETARVLGHIATDRNLADYDSAVDISAEAAAEDIATAERFLDEVDRILGVG